MKTWLLSESSLVIVNNVLHFDKMLKKVIQSFVPFKVKPFQTYYVVSFDHEAYQVIAFFFLFKHSLLLFISS